MEPFVIGIGIGLAAMLMAGKKGPKAASLPQPDPKDMKAITEWRSTPQGKARYFRKEFIPSIAIQLGTLGVEKVADKVYKGARVVVYRLFPAAGGAPSPSALDIGKLGYGYNAAVLVTANTWLKSGGESYLAVIPYEQRAEWSNVGRQWAIEFDNQAGNDQPVPVVPGRKGPDAGKSLLFDANMTQDEVEATSAMLASDAYAAEWYDGQAIMAETPGHGGTNHGVHPLAAKALRAKAAKLRDVVLKKEPPKDDPLRKLPPKIDPGKPDVVDVDVDDDTPPGVIPDDGPPPPPEKFMHTIRTGDIPSLMASYYTGDGSRYKDLAAIKSNGLGLGGQYGMTGWTVGKTIELPASWDPWGKPVPGVAQAAPPTYVDPGDDASNSDEDAGKDAAEAAYEKAIDDAKDPWGGLGLG